MYYDFHVFFSRFQRNYKIQGVLGVLYKHRAQKSQKGLKGCFEGAFGGWFLDV